MFLLSEVVFGGLNVKNTVTHLFKVQTLNWLFIQDISSRCNCLHTICRSTYVTLQYSGLPTLLTEGTEI